MIYFTNQSGTREFPQRGRNPPRPSSSSSFLSSYSGGLSPRSPCSSPASSSALNPFKWLWSDLKRFVRTKKFTNEHEIIAAVFEFHKILTPQKCRKYINKLHEVCET